MEKISQVRKFVESLECKMHDNDSICTSLNANGGDGSIETSNEGSCTNSECVNSKNKLNCINYKVCSGSTNDGKCENRGSGGGCGGHGPVDTQGIGFPGLSF